MTNKVIPFPPKQELEPRSIWLAKELIAQIEMRLSYFPEGEAVEARTIIATDLLFRQLLLGYITTEEFEEHCNAMIIRTYDIVYGEGE